LLQERIAELKSDIKFSKDGKLFGIDIYDAEDIPQQFKDAQEKFGKNWYDYFIHPYNALLYSIPEVASTVGMYKYQAYALGFDGMLGYLSSRLPTWAMKGGPVSGAIMGAAGEFLAGRGGRAAMATAGYAAAVESRKVETGLEAMQAMGDRVSK